MLLTMLLYFIYLQMFEKYFKILGADYSRKKDKNSRQNVCSMACNFVLLRSLGILSVGSVKANGLCRTISNIYCEL